MWTRSPSALIALLAFAAPLIIAVAGCQSSTAPACGPDSLNIAGTGQAAQCFAMVSGFVRVALTNSTADSVGIFWDDDGRREGAVPDTNAGPGQPIYCFKFFAYTWYQFAVRAADTIGLATDALAPRDHPGWQVTVTQDSAAHLHFAMTPKDTTTFVSCP